MSCIKSQALFTMEKDHFLKILSKVQDRTATEEEENFLRAYDRMFDKQPDGLSHLSPAELKAMEKKIRSGIAREMGDRPVRISLIPGVRHWWLAASLGILCAAGMILYLSRREEGMIRYTGKAHTILPGNKGAVLILGNGKRIDLSAAAKGVVAVQGNMNIAKTASGIIEYVAANTAQPGEKPSWNSIVTPRGSIVAVLLPDGSKAYLNAGSSLRFPAAFTDAERAVELSGEAEFEVRHQPSRPFVVSSAGQKVAVLGTHFNVNAYPGSRRARTTLITGSIALSSSVATRILKPGQQASIAAGNSDQNISIRELSEPAEAIAWRKGIFHFENSSIQEVMKVFSLWYDVDIVVEADVPERLFSGDIHKTLSLEKALKLLNYHQVYFEINGRSIRVRS